MLNKGFTFIELLVVIGIISILVVMEVFTYTNSQRSARDGKRKADLENIRAALEQYRSANNSYPPISSITFNPSCTANGPLQDANTPPNTYINPLPSDPYCQLYTYYYSASSASSSSCDGTNTVCTNYTLGARLESVPAPTCVASGTVCQYSPVSNVCNYCLGPYGAK